MGRSFFFEIVGCTLFSIILASKAFGQPNPPLGNDKVAVVTTWGELRAQQPIDVGGTLVRIGIEGNKASMNSGVLFYCLTDNYIPPLSQVWLNGIGPISYTFELDGQKFDSPEAKISVTEVPSEWKSSSLYIRRLLF